MNLSPCISVLKLPMQIRPIFLFPSMPMEIPISLVTGTETLVLGLHRAGENFEVAKKENSVIFLEDDYHTRYEGFDPNSPESYIIFSLMQNLYFEQSINMAALVAGSVQGKGTTKGQGSETAGIAGSGADFHAGNSD